MASTNDIDDMSQEDFESQLTQVPVGGGSKKPTRGRGRPSTKKTSTPVHKVNITAKIKAWLLMANSLAAVYPPIRDDLLDMVELDAMAEAINAVAQENTMLYKALDNIVSSGSYIQLAMVIGLIGVRRAARRNILPPQMDQVGEALLSGNMEDMMGMMNTAANEPEFVMPND